MKSKKLLTAQRSVVLPLRSHAARKHRLRPVWAHGNDFDRRADELADAIEIFASTGRHVFEVADLRDIGLPAGQRFVDRRAAPQVIDVAITPENRKFLWPVGPRPTSHAGGDRTRSMSPCFRPGRCRWVFRSA